MKNSILTLALLSSFYSFCQPGYMGKLNIVNAGLDIHPNLCNFGVFPSLIALDGVVGYERAINRKFSLGAEYKYQRFRVPSVDGYLYFDNETQDFRQNLGMVAHHFDTKFIMYKSQGSIAPFGTSRVLSLGIVRTGIENTSIRTTSPESPNRIGNFNYTLIHLGYSYMRKISLGGNLLLNYGFGFNFYYNLGLDFTDHLGYIQYHITGSTVSSFPFGITSHTYNESGSTENKLEQYFKHGSYARLLALNLLNVKVVLELPF